MPKKSRQKLKYLENEKSFQDEIKSTFHHFWRAIIETNNKKMIFWEVKLIWFAYSYSIANRWIFNWWMSTYWAIICFSCGITFFENWCYFSFFKYFRKSATSYRQGKYCNNLATRVIPFFIVSKSSVGETILKTVLPHFSKDPVAWIPMTS